MKCFILGSGGREHALGWKLSMEIGKKNLFFAPGNGGTLTVGTNLDINPLDFDKIKNFIDEQKIDLVVIGPEQPLVNGITDFLTSSFPDLAVVGPSAEAAKLEGSKAFAKSFMNKYGIPTAKYEAFSKNEFQKAKDFLSTLRPPYVLKADGLAAGKGVIITSDFKQAIKELENIFAGKFGKAGEKVVIEEFLEGKEFSVFVITNGKDYKILPVAKDYKRVGEGDTGLNTGGMGCVSPVPFAEPLLDYTEKNIIKPTIEGIKAENLDYKGFLYFGLINVKGKPYVLEYNVRMGDPETQAVIPKIKSGFAELLFNINKNNFANINLKFFEDFFVGVVLASKGYPLKYEKDKIIHLPNNLPEQTIVFQAGTKKDKDGQLLTNGGRVLTTIAWDKDLIKAREKAYDLVEKIKFENKYFRTDIASDIQT